MRRLLLILLVLGISRIDAPQPAGAAEKQTQPRFELRDGDRVVLLGNTLVERAQKYGHWETLLTARFPRRNVIFRNLGWSGDTVWAESRGLFDAPVKGYQRMLAHIGKLKPTVIFLGYGGNEAYAGRRGLAAFLKQYDRLIDDLTAASAPGVRFVILSPIQHENLGPPLPDPAEINRKLALYTRALREIARRRGCRFIDLYSSWKLLPLDVAAHLPRKAMNHLTDDGMHLTPAGYFVTGVRIMHSLSLLKPAVDVRLTTQGRITRATGAKLSRINTAGGRLSFQFRADTLQRSVDRFQIDGAPVVGFTLRIDGKRAVSATGRQWASGVVLADSPDFRQWERLRKTIIEKNRFYFYRWRPQNVTYLFLFRKHEQGQNAKEVPQFDKFVAAKEKEIVRLRQPVAHSDELIPINK